MQKAVFTSNISSYDAKHKANIAGYEVIGEARNPNGQFIVFGRKQ